MALMRSMMVKILLIYLMSGCHKANGRCRSAKGTCPSDWNQWGDNCYKATDKRPWSEARDECVRIGGVMATPNSLQENAYIWSLTYDVSDGTWINCNDLETEGIWNCTGTSDTHYRNWGSNQPDDTEGEIEQDCGVITSQLSWDDRPCYKHRPAVCKQPVPPRWQ